MAMTTTQRSATTLTSGRGWDSGCTLSGIDVREEKSRSLVPERKWRAPVGTTMACAALTYADRGKSGWADTN
jgi:hypothetical protein